MKDTLLRVRCSEEYKANVSKAAKDKDMSLSEYVCWCLDNVDIYAAPISSGQIRCSTCDNVATLSGQDNVANVATTNEDEETVYKLDRMSPQELVDAGVLPYKTKSPILQKRYKEMAILHKKDIVASKHTCNLSFECVTGKCIGRQGK